MVLTTEQTEQLAQLLEEPWSAIGASQSSGKAFYVLKAINDQIKADGLDWQYDLNEKGKQLQALYEQIYQANQAEFEKE